MSRIRTIKPEFWEDETIGALPLGARLLFIAAWNVADDEGLLRWTPEYMKAKAFVYDDHTLSQVADWMEALEKAELVHAYRAGRAQERAVYIVNFRKHQRIDKPQPGRLAPPSLSNRDNREMYFRRDGYMCHICGAPTNESRALVGNVYDHDSPQYAPDAPQPENDPSPDHLIPRSRGGSDYPSNIKTAHIHCNKARGDSPPPAGSGNSQNGPGLFPDYSQEEGKGKGSGTRKGNGNYPPEFEQFWINYPRKIGKADALRNWTKAIRAGASPSRLSEAAVCYGDLCKATNREVRFIPHPATWINRGSWDDDLEGEKQQATAAGKTTGKPDWMSQEAWEADWFGNEEPE